MILSWHELYIFIRIQIKYNISVEGSSYRDTFMTLGVSWDTFSSFIGHVSPYNQTDKRTSKKDAKMDR